MNMNMNIDFTSPVMLVLLSVGVMVLLNMVLPMLPPMPILEQVVDAARTTQGNLVGSALYVAVVVYVASILKDMLQL